MQSHGSARLLSRFSSRFGSAREPLVFQAPGRINLIGEHTDYNQGFVLPAAVNFRTRAAIAAAATQRLSAFSVNVGEEAYLDLDAPPSGPRGHWSDYVFGVALELKRAGFDLPGVDLMIESEVPLGAGLSSSAALEVVTAFSLLGVAQQSAEPREIALLCQRAENEFVGARVGIMDQFASCFGKKGHALLIDCRSLEIAYYPLPASDCMIVCNTMVRHSLASGEYNRRREECEAAVRALAEKGVNLNSLRDLTPEQLAGFEFEMDPLLFRRARHVTSENQRVLDAVRCLEERDSVSFGRLMAMSHASLRDDYEVSSAELDVAAQIAAEQPGVYGSRMMGGGFGGCVISLAERAKAEAITQALSSEYLARTGRGCEIYICEAGSGAGEERP